MADFSIEVAFVLLEGQPVCVGRNPESHVPLQSTEFPLLASRAHALFHLRGHKLFVEDLKSTNGTYVNDVRVASSSAFPVKDNTVVSFGGPRKVINQGSLCPNPFCYTVQVLRTSPNTAPISVTVSSCNPESTEHPPSEPEPVPTGPPSAPLPQNNAVIDLTEVRNLMRS